MAGKGDKPRPINKLKYDENFNYIFRKKMKPQCKELIEYKNHFYEEYGYGGKRRQTETSQNGEDGVVKEILNRLDVQTGWVCEFGANTGTWNSNTFELVKRGFKAIYIEGEEGPYEGLLETVKDHPNITPIKAFVDYNDTENSLDNLLKKTDIPVDFDLLSIDTDGYDYQIWKQVKHYKPKVVIVEINSSVSPHDEKHIHEPGAYRFTGFLPMYNLGKEKGYTFALHTGNMFFVRNDLFDKLGIKYDDPVENFRRSWYPTIKKEEI